MLKLKKIVKLQSALRTRFCQLIINQAKENYYIADNDFVRFIDYFNIGVVIIKDYKNPKNLFKESKYFISDCDFNASKKKHMFEYCEYFVIIVYFDNIHFDLFHK